MQQGFLHWPTTPGWKLMRYMERQVCALRVSRANKQQMPTTEQKCCANLMAKPERAGSEQLHYCGFLMGEK
jgi:hypothetical protein